MMSLVWLWSFATFYGPGLSAAVPESAEAKLAAGGEMIKVKPAFS